MIERPRVVRVHGRRRQAAKARRLLRRSAWKGLLAFALASVALHVLVLHPSQRPAAYVLMGGLAPIAVLAGVRLGRPRRARAWYLLVAGLAIMSLADVARLALTGQPGGTPVPSVADAVRLGGYALLIAGMTILAGGATPGSTRAGLLDAMIVATAASWIVWLYVVLPIASGPSTTWAEESVAMAYPGVGLVMLAAVGRLVFFGRVRSPSILLLVAGILVLLTSDLVFMIDALRGSSGMATIAEAGRLGAPMLWSVSALHPSMRTASGANWFTGNYVSRGQTAALMLTALIPTLALLVENWRGGEVPLPSYVEGSVLLTVLVLARLGASLADLRTALAERRTLESRLQHQAEHDPLVGVWNRTSFFDRLRVAFVTRRSRLGVLFVDLDDFKAINDDLGHAVGDAALIEVGSRIRSMLRPSDVVGRMGGDEFAVLIDPCTGPDHAARIAERLLGVLGTSCEIEQHRIHLSASIGIALAEPGHGSPDELIRDADVAMYEAKAAGKSRYSFFEHSMYESMHGRLQLRAELADGISRGQFVLEFQPIVEVASGRLDGFEALVRWNHPERGRLLPAHFLPIAEESGLIVPLGRWILHEACRQAREWRLGDRDPSLKMSVNVSAAQLHQPDVVNEVQAALRETGIHPSTLVLEMTETTLLDVEHAFETVVALRALGIELALDNFGIGYSSLSYLGRLPIDILKVDRSFVAEMADDPKKAALIEAIVGLGRSLGLATLAEGIETADQLRRLGQLGCDLGQGFLIGRPMSAESAAGLLAEIGHRGSSPTGERGPRPVGS